MLKHHGLSANTLSFGIGDVWISIFTTPYSSDTMVEVIKLRVSVSPSANCLPLSIARVGDNAYKAQILLISQTGIYYEKLF